MEGYFVKHYHFLNEFCHALPLKIFLFGSRVHCEYCSVAQMTAELLGSGDGAAQGGYLCVLHSHTESLNESPRTDKGLFLSTAEISTPSKKQRHIKEHVSKNWSFLVEKRGR
jgi:hypothetical protein